MLQEKKIFGNLLGQYFLDSHVENQEKNVNKWIFPGMYISSQNTKQNSGY